jgi:hypothetical protein
MPSDAFAEKPPVGLNVQGKQVSPLTGNGFVPYRPKSRPNNIMKGPVEQEQP